MFSEKVHISHDAVNETDTGVESLAHLSKEKEKQIQRGHSNQGTFCILFLAVLQTVDVLRMLGGNAKGRA